MSAANRQSIEDTAIARTMKDHPFRMMARADDDDLVEGDVFRRELLLRPAYFVLRFRNYSEEFEKGPQPSLYQAHHATRCRKGSMSAMPQ